MINYPYETFNPTSFQNEMKRALRCMRGHPCYEIRFEIGQDEAEFLADYAHLTAPEDRTEEVQLSSSCSRLLQACMTIRDDFRAMAADGEPDQDKLNDFAQRALLKVLRS